MASLTILGFLCCEEWRTIMYSEYYPHLKNGTAYRQVRPTKLGYLYLDLPAKSSQFSLARPTGTVVRRLGLSSGAIA